MATNYTELRDMCISAKSRGLSRIQFLVQVCTEYGCNLNAAEGKYLGLLQICMNLKDDELQSLLFSQINFDDVSIGKWSLIAYRRVPKRFGGEAKTVHANLTMDNLLTIKRKCVLATGKERTTKVELYYEGKLIKTV